MGLRRRANQVYAIEFGLAKKYKDSSTHQHIRFYVFKERITDVKQSNAKHEIKKTKKIKFPGFCGHAKTWVSIFATREELKKRAFRPIFDTSRSRAPRRRFSLSLGRLFLIFHDCKS
ncbi:hypothetical protein L1987_52646 [Smallanthus sonchifolius]|uniref:Uncharacterized protein n=1 Tax=Smallanthus sonchifolius TaxID=185202 RepID=A0ACB9EUU5_9ASTR|nr:hypothetical protein L1987_52646 [Smallanthus sonchifolius]